MIEAAMYGVLGALAAGLVALILIPPFWRRAVRLNRRDIEATLPTTRAELDAFRDQLRAGFAVQARQFEQTIETLGERIAAREIELGQKQQIITHLTSESSLAAEGLGLVERQRALLQTSLATRDLQLAEADEGRKSAEKRLLELEGRLDAARQQLEIVVAEREAEREALALRDAEVALLRNQVATAAKTAGQSGSLVLEMAELRTALASEQMRSEAAQGAVRAAEAGRRAADVELQAGAVALSALREQLTEARSRIDTLSARLVEAEAGGMGAAALREENTALEAQIAALEAANMRLTSAGSAMDAADGSAALRQKLIEIGEAVARLSAPSGPTIAALPAPSDAGAVAIEGGSIVPLLPAPATQDIPAERPAAAPAVPMGLAERIRALQQTSKAV